jgi:hypothetical protein
VDQIHGETHAPRLIKGEDQQLSAPRVMARWEQFRSRVRSSLIRLRRRLPYLVWWNDELDVTVTLSQDKLPATKLQPGESMAVAIQPLFNGAFAEIERTFEEMGITFDTSMGVEGRDWEWDFSLKGPISVRFCGRASKPELRRDLARPRPHLVPKT